MFFLQWKRDVTDLLAAIKGSMIDVKQQLTLLNREVFKMDAVAQKLSDDLTALQTGITSGLKDLSDQITNLKNQIAAGVPATDEELTALDDKVVSMIGAVSGVDPGPQPTP